MDLNVLLNYDSWANSKIFRSLGQLPESKERSQISILFAHILTAQLMWVNRIKKEPLPADTWPSLSIQEIETHLQHNLRKLKELISKKDEVIHYKNSKGEIFTNSVEEILVHLTIHGQHHRAQIATLLRQAGQTPPATDFIFFIRTI
tara:strand:+ start:595 stop:1035 length:441 start_codon:yes stop_codon:yes gene_type:complete